MNLDIVAQYIPDGDVLFVVIYVTTDAGVKSTKSVLAGTCELRQGTTTYQTAEFDRYFGNSDGSFRITLNHPVIIGGAVFVSVTLLDSTVLTSLATVQIMPPEPHAPLSDNA